MDQLLQIQTRIANLKELRNLIQALRAMAATQVQAAQIELSGVRSYISIIEDAIVSGVNLLPQSMAAFVEPEQESKKALIVFCSEHGFAGAFNEHVLDKAEQERQTDQDYIVIGQRGARLAQERGWRIRWQYPMATHVGGVLSVARRIAAQLADVTAADAVFASYRSAGSYDIQVRTLLPVDFSLIEQSAAQNTPLHHLDPVTLLEQLANEYLLGEVTRMLMDSFASESGARLSIMTSADRNIADNLQTLERSALHLRQEEITSELLDIVTGYEAINGVDAPTV